MSEVSIDILNDYCLLHILELLTLKKRFKVELVCKRWQRLCRQLWKSTQKLVLGRNIPEYCSFGYMYKKPILEPLLMLCGTNLRSLTVSYRLENNIFKLITQYCDSLNSLMLVDCDIPRDPGIENFCIKHHSLTEIKFHDVNITDKQLENIFISQPKLKCLELSSVYNKPNFDKLNKEVESISLKNCYYLENDYIIRNLNKFKHLKKLHVYTRNTLRINDLVKEIPQIEDLKIGIDRCINEELREIGVLINLRSLNLDLLGSITDNTMADIVENCRLLECIHFGSSVNDCPVTSEGLKRMSELPELNKIHMYRMKQINNEVLEMWAMNGKLTHIDVFDCCNVRDRGVIAVLEQCPHLQELNITRCKITKVALFKAVEVAERRSLTPLLRIFIEPFDENLQIDASKYQNTCLKII